MLEFEFELALEFAHDFALEFTLEFVLEVTLEFTLESVFYFLLKDNDNLITCVHTYTTLTVIHNAYPPMS